MCLLVSGVSQDPVSDRGSVIRGCAGGFHLHMYGDSGELDRSSLCCCLVSILTADLLQHVTALRLSKMVRVLSVKKVFKPH